MQTKRLIGLLEEAALWIETSKDPAISLCADLRKAAGVLSGPAPVIDLDTVDWAAIQEAASQSSWMPPEYLRNEWVSDVCSWLKDGPPKRKLEIGDAGEGSYSAWLTDTDGNIHPTVVCAHPYAAADWCERNGFAWEVVGATGDPLVDLAAWRAAQ